MKRYDEILEERGRLVNQMQELSAAHPDGFDSETKEKYDRLSAKQQELKDTADRLYNEEKLAAEMAATRKPVKPEAAPVTDGKKAFENYLRKGTISNALEVGTVGEGGYLTHDEFNNELLRVREKFNPFRSVCRTIRTTGDHNIRVEASTGTASWIDEEGTYTASDPAFTQVTLNAYKLTRLVLVSEELLQDSDFDIAAYLAEEFGRSFARAEELAFIQGSGTLQPTGMQTGAGSVTRTESPLQATVTANTLLDAYYGLGEVYRMDATWLFNDATVRSIRGITDANDNFIWQPGLQAGQPDRVLGRPYIVSEHMPAAGESPLQSPVIFGDMRNYVIADRTGFSVQRLNELYAATGQVGFRAWSRVDGKVVQSAGIKKIAAF